MSHDDGFLDYLCELLLPLGQAQGRPMFGGFGMYLDGLMIGLVIDGGFFLKADELSKDKFVAAGCEPFVYHGQEKPITMSYWSVPAEALESESEMEPWARLAIAAAERKANAKKLEQRAAEPRRAKAR